MTRERRTLIAGLLASIVSLAALLGTEGVFFTTPPPPIVLNISGFDCQNRGFAMAETLSGALSAGVEPPAALAMTADLILELDLAPFADSGCRYVALTPRRPVVFTVRSPHYARTDVRLDSHNGQPLRIEGVFFERTPHPAAEDREASVLSARLPGALQRIRADAYAARISVSGVARIGFIETHRIRGQGFYDADQRQIDAVFALERFRRLANLAAILFAAMLGVGLGAVFEAGLMAATRRRLDAVAREIGTAPPAGRKSGGDGGDGDDV